MVATHRSWIPALAILTWSSTAVAQWEPGLAGLWDPADTLAQDIAIVTDIAPEEQGWTNNILYCSREDVSACLAGTGTSVTLIVIDSPVLDGSTSAIQAHHATLLDVLSWAEDQTAPPDLLATDLTVERAWLTPQEHGAVSRHQELLDDVILSSQVPFIARDTVVAGLQ